MLRGASLFVTSRRVTYEDWTHPPATAMAPPSWEPRLVQKMIDVTYFYYGLVGVVKTSRGLSPHVIETFELKTWFGSHVLAHVIGSNSVTLRLTARAIA